MTTLRITPLHPSLGAEVAGVDLSRPIDEATQQALSSSLADHLVLVLRDQSVTPAQYLAAASGQHEPLRQLGRVPPPQWDRAAAECFAQLTRRRK